MSKTTMTNITQNIRDVILKIKPVDELEAEHVNDALRWIDSTEQIFRLQKPDIPPKHLVSYAVLLDIEKNKLLLMDHINAELWLPCGGHVEPGEHPWSAALREIKEELNSDAKLYWDEPVFITVTETVGKTAGHTDVSLWYVFMGDSEMKIEFDNSEFNGYRWFDLEEILQSPSGKFDPHMQRFTRKLTGLLGS
jgi:8-oxo-dGTP pyrophosphatase MutT (NUDIX family)